MSRSLTILHLSDLQFGRHHRYPKGDESYQSLYAKLAEDLDDLAKRHEVRPAAIVVTGDVAEMSVPAEYDAAERLLDQLGTHVGVPRQRVIVVPGNHDVNWDLCQAARLIAKATNQGFAEPYFAKFGNYQQFFHRFYAGTEFLFDDEHLFQVYSIPEQRTLIVGFNSCLRESEQADDHYGWISVDQARRAVQRCDDIDPDQAWLRIAALHHNFIGGSKQDSENLRDRDDILPTLYQGRFRLVLHGHRHIAGVQHYGTHLGPPLAIVAAGSAGLDYKTLPEHPNQYQALRIDDGRDVTMWMRQYSAQTFGLSGQGKWTADASIDETGIVRFQLSAAAPPAGLGGPRPPRTTFPAARKRFLAYLAEEHRFLQLRGFSGDVRVPIELEPIYVALRAVPSHCESGPRPPGGGPSGDESLPGDDGDAETAGRRPAATEEEMDLGAALEFCEAQRYSGLVVLGDPGSGKTTLLKHLTLCLAQPQPGRGTLVRSKRVPIYLALRDVADFALTLDDALRAAYPMGQLDLSGDFFQRLLDDERHPCLLLLDGLDEVATPERRREALDWIECQRKRYPHNLIVVTSRFAGYRGTTRLPENYLELHVRDFRDDDVRSFVRRWYHQVETRQRGDAVPWRDLAQRQSDDLLRRLESAQGLLALARNPLMLQIICLVHRAHGTMPQRRTELYEECVKVLLQKWDEAKGLEVFLTAAEARRVLRPLALWLHQEEGRTHADVEEVKRIIGPHLAQVKRETKQRAEEQLDRVLTSVRDRSGLFVGFDVTRYGFQHLSFQEFLAAEEIVKQRQDQQLVETFGRSWWREPTLLALGMDDPQFQSTLLADLVRAAPQRNNLDLLLACVREAMAPGVEPFAAALADRQLPWPVRHAAVMCLREIGGVEAAPALRTALDDPQAEVAAAARDALVRIGELPAEIVAAAVVSRDTIINPIDGTELIRIPAGEFIMGSDDGPEEERPQQRLYLDEYYIARYPVTNDQYRRFMEATKHGKPYYWDDKRFNQPNQPVVGVRWYDAMGYCKWAGLRLPTEREWEKAARGTDGRPWPWGNEPPDTKRCNFGSNVGATSEVGSYPDGASPYGCLDMAGNVWEWCLTKWRSSYQTPPDDSPEGDAPRVLRGGYWGSSADRVRGGCRDWFPPVGLWSYGGFRLAQ